jgi:small subunit ribosomal protein S8
MSMTDPLGDMLTRIRNAQMRRKSRVSTPGSSLRGRVLDVLKSEGYIRDYSVTEFGNGRTDFDIELKYFDGQPVIKTIQRVSKPGRRVYVSVDNMPRVANGLGVTIVSTPMGVMADYMARESNVGGEANVPSRKDGRCNPGRLPGAHGRQCDHRQGPQGRTQVRRL